ncbi:MAG: hypothetical protein Q4C33_03340 [bacterium]|nr:hypothetical protein [bacterium]
MKKNIEKLNTELDANNKVIDRVGMKLSEREIPLSELGSLSIELNKASSENREINDEINKYSKCKNVYKTNDELDKNEKANAKRFIAGIILSIIIFVMCLVNRPLAVLLFFVDLGLLGKNLLDTDYKSLQKMKARTYNQKTRIARFKKDIGIKTQLSKKKIDEKEWSGTGLEAIFDNAVKCVESLLSGKDIEIESPLLRSVVFELLKDDNYPDATIEELVSMRRKKMGEAPVLKKDKN